MAAARGRCRSKRFDLFFFARVLCRCSTRAGGVAWPCAAAFWPDVIIKKKKNKCGRQRDRCPRLDLLFLLVFLFRHCSAGHLFGGKLFCHPKPREKTIALDQCLLRMRDSRARNVTRFEKSKRNFYHLFTLRKSFGVMYFEFLFLSKSTLPPSLEFPGTRRHVPQGFDNCSG